ncbi:MAG: BON domain-containing protein [Panacagrimonas sp.]
MKLSTFILAASTATGLAAIPTISLAEATLGQKAGAAVEKTGEYVTDSALTAKVKTALIAETKLESMKIEVESTQGVVTLSGEVPDKASVKLADSIVAKVEGVKDVHNKLRVSRSS